MFISLFLAVATHLIPNPEAFLGWRTVQGYTTSDVKIDQLQKVGLNCQLDNKNLYPTHPQQESKHYHLFDWGSYNHGKLNGDSEACTISSKYKNRNGQYACLRPDVVYNVVMSDIYQDKCGNLYRAFKQTIYLDKNESMGTLLSRGRTIYPNPNSQFPGEVYVGPTYPVPVQEFLFLTLPLAGDIEKSNQMKRRALSTTHTFDALELLFNNR
jgi:hypothetical protein